MPPFGWLTGGIDFSKLRWVIRPADDSDPVHKVTEVAIRYGQFINTVITFVIVAFAIFMGMKVINRMHRKAEAAPAPPADVVLLTEIRDLLKDKP